MELKQYVTTLWKWSWLIVLATAVAAASGYWGSRQMPRVYRTSTTLMVGQLLQSRDPSTQEFYTSEKLAQTYVQLVRRQPILQATVEELGLNMNWQGLAGRVNGGTIAGTQLFQISVADTNPQRAQTLANEIAHQLILQSPTTPEKEQEQHRQFVSEQLVNLQAQIDDAEAQIDQLEERLAVESSARAIQDLESQIAAIQQKITTWQSNYADLLAFFSESRINSLTVVEPATIRTTPISPKTKFNILLAASVGFLLATSAAFLLEYLDDTVKSDEDVGRVLGLPTLGAITTIKGIKEPPDNLITIQHPRSPVSEAYRVLRTNLQFSNLNNPTATVVVTSASNGEGKTTTAANLAVTMAQAGKQVILVDADLRRPDLHRLFGLPNKVGLTSLLLDETMSLETALVDTGPESLRVLPSGHLPPNPAELLSSQPLQKRINQMQEWADVVIFDSPPLLAVADATILGSYCGGVVLVVRAGRTRSETIRRGKEALEQVGVKILGVVLAQVSTRRFANYYDYYYGHYSHISDNGNRSAKPASAPVDRTKVRER
jgi:capsular exopolysaccharide synthesis family protein